jgi:septal ring factor EnvC (AmiA/AmiB activator)
MGCGFRCPRGDMEAHIADAAFHLPVFFLQLTTVQATVQKQATTIRQLQSADEQLQATVQKQATTIRQLQSADEQLQATVQKQGAEIEHLVFFGFYGFWGD